jgi:hypothetical protein
LTERQIAVGFQSLIPFRTRLTAEPDARVTLNIRHDIPTPTTNGEIDTGVTAFTVEIPFVPPHTAISFDVWTDDRGNNLACKFMSGEVRDRQRSGVLRHAAEWTRSEGSEFKVDDLLIGALKREELYIPGFVISDSSRKQVEFVKPAETLAQTLYAKLFDKSVPARERKSSSYNCGLVVSAAEGTGGTPHLFWSTLPLVPSYMRINLYGPDDKASSSRGETEQPQPGTFSRNPKVPEEYRCMQTTPPPDLSGEMLIFEIVYRL